jgi:hypothetical protein
MADETKPSGSFCGKSQDKVAILIRGERGAHICEECVVVCVDLLKQKSVWPSLPVRVFRTLRYRLGGRPDRPEPS